MQKKLKIVMIIAIVCYCMYKIIQWCICEPSYAASNANSESDVQLIARAINGEARGESYEGQVAVRSCYSKQSERPKFSKYHFRSNLSTGSIYGCIGWTN